MKKSLLLLISFFSLWNAQAQTVHRMLSSSRSNDSLWVTDTNTFQIVNRLSFIPATGGAIIGTQGMARQPHSGSLYTAFRQTGELNRILGKVDLATNVVTIIGNLGDKFSSITFRGDSLFGVTGNGGTVPESLFLIDTLTAATTFLRTLGAGSDGEVICYNPATDLIYHWSGNTTVEFESVLPYPPYTNTPIVSSTTISNETFGAVYVAPDKFLVSNLNYVFDYWNINGSFHYSGSDSTWELARGMAFISCNRSVSGGASICSGDSVMLTASTSPSYQWYRNGTPIPGATLQNYFAALSGDFNCMVSDECGMDTCMTGTLVLASSPFVDLGPDTASCGPVLLDAGNPGSNYLWTGADTMQTLSVITSGLYDVIVMDTNGCTGSDTIDITINALPSATISTSSTLICIYNSPVTLVTTPVGGTITGIGVVGSTFDPQVSGAGTFYPLYTYADTNGCVATDSVQLDVDLCLGIDAMTANGITIYPNPTGSNVFVDLSGLNETLVFTMTDVSGKSVINQQISAGSIVNIDLSFVDKGMYIVQIRNREVLLQKRIVIAR